jgi:protein SCO1
MRPWLASLACAMLLGAPALAHHGKEQPANRGSERWPVDAFALTDQRGRPFTQDQLQGRWTFVLFGDTRCGESCSAPLTALTGLLQRIARTDAVKTTQVIFVSLDPQRDTPQRLGEYVARFDPRFIGGTASSATLQRLADDLGTAGRIVPAASPDGMPSYPGSIVLIGPDATVRVEYLPPFDVLLLTANYLKTRARR